MPRLILHQPINCLYQLVTKFPQAQPPPYYSATPVVFRGGTGCIEFQPNPSLSLRRHAHKPLAEHSVHMHMAQNIENTFDDFSTILQDLQETYVSLFFKAFFFFTAWVVNTVMEFRPSAVSMKVGLHKTSPISNTSLWAELRVMG